METQTIMPMQNKNVVESIIASILSTLSPGKMENPVQPCEFTAATIVSAIAFSSSFVRP